MNARLAASVGLGLLATWALAAALGRAPPSRKPELRVVSVQQVELPERPPPPPSQPEATEAQEPHALHVDTPLAPPSLAPALSGLPALPSGAGPQVSRRSQPARAQPTRELRATEVERPPRLIRGPAPRFPAQAERKGRSGQVRLRFRVSPNGRVDRVEVLSGEPPFVGAASQTVRGWRFQPARDRGKQVAVWIEKRFRFEAER